MNRKKNVLLVIPNLDFGGAQTSFSKLSIELGLHYNVINVVFNKNNIADFQYGGPLLDLNVPASTFFLSKVINFFKRVSRLKRIKREHHIDISISFLEGADYVNVLSAIGEKIILSVRGSKKYDQNIYGVMGYFRHRWLLPNLYNRAHSLVAVNKGIAEELIREYKIRKPIAIIYNFYNSEKLKSLAAISPDPTFATLSEKYKLICIVGRLAPEKGIDKFLPVFFEVRRQIPDCKLILIGDGDHRNSLEAQSRSLGLKTSSSFDERADVFFAGYRPNPYSFMSRCSLLALPSLHEGFPNVLVEAMSLGVPVVAADCPYGPREILGTDKHLSRVLLPVLSSESSLNAWIKELSALIQNQHEHQQISDVGKQMANTFSDGQTLYQWLELIDG